MIEGREYLLRGEAVRVVVAWTGKRGPELARVRDLLPLVRTRAAAPMNVLLEHPDGRREVRPFRGLRKPDTTP